MADKNNLMPRNLNMLRLNPEELALFKLTQDQPSFEERMQMQLLGGDMSRPMVRPSFSLMGNSGGYNMEVPNRPQMPYMPPMANARVGLESDVGAGQLRGGIGVGAMQAMNDKLRFMPPTADVGYSMPMAGGQLDVGAMSPIERANLSKMMLNARYSRPF